MPYIIKSTPKGYGLWNIDKKYGNYLIQLKKSEAQNDY